MEESLYSWCISLYTSPCTNKCFVVVITLLTYPSIQNCETCFLVSIFLLHSVSYLYFICNLISKGLCHFPNAAVLSILYMINKDALCHLSQQTPCPCCMILIFRDQRTNSILTFDYIGEFYFLDHAEIQYLPSSTLFAIDTHYSNNHSLETSNSLN